MPSQQRRLQILKSAVAILRERQVAELTMRDIANRLGLTKGNIYYYFRSKQDLLFQCHVKAMEDSLHAIADVQRMGGSAGLRLAALIRLLVRSVIDDPYGAIVLTSLQELTARQRARYIGLRDRVEAYVRELIVEGSAAGEFRATNPKIAAFAILGAINAIPKWYDAAGPSPPADIADIFAAVLANGIARSPR